MPSFKEISHVFIERTHMSTTLLYHSIGIRGHQHTRTEPIKVGFADTRRTHTKHWAKYALQLIRSMTIKDVADLLGVTWDMIWEIKKNDLRRRFANPSLKNVRRIAIDEICIGKGHRYVTLVMDLDCGASATVPRGNRR